MKIKLSYSDLIKAISSYVCQEGLGYMPRDKDIKFKHKEGLQVKDLIFVEINMNQNFSKE